MLGTIYKSLNKDFFFQDRSEKEARLSLVDRGPELWIGVSWCHPPRFWEVGQQPSPVLSGHHALAAWLAEPASTRKLCCGKGKSGGGGWAGSPGTDFSSVSSACACSQLRTPAWGAAWWVVTPWRRDRSLPGTWERPGDMEGRTHAAPASTAGVEKAPVCELIQDIRILYQYKNVLRLKTCWISACSQTEIFDAKFAFDKVTDSVILVTSFL